MNTRPLLMFRYHVRIANNVTENTIHTEIYTTNIINEFSTLKEGPLLDPRQQLESKSYNNNRRQIAQYIFAPVMEGKQIGNL